MLEGGQPSHWLRSTQDLRGRMNLKIFAAALAVALAALGCTPSAHAQATSAADCAKLRDTYKIQLIEFNKGADLGRAMLEKMAKDAGKSAATGGSRDQEYRPDPEKLAAAKYQECLAKGAKPAEASGAGSAVAAAKPTGLRTATAAEVAECRTESGKLGGVVTLDTSTQKMTERKPDARDHAKFGGQIFEACLKTKGAAAPADMTAPPAVKGVCTIQRCGREEIDAARQADNRP